MLIIGCVFFFYKSIASLKSQSRSAGCWRKTYLSVPKMLANVTATMNGTQATNCLDPSVVKKGKTFAFCLLFVVSLVGNTLIGVIIYRTKSLRKPVNFFIANMAVSDLLIPIFLFPMKLVGLYTESWKGGDGPFGQSLCKLVHFSVDASAVVSIQSLVLIAVDRFGGVVVPLRAPLISSKKYRFYILATWIIAVAVQCPNLFALKVVEYQGGLQCYLLWNDAFGESFSYQDYILAKHIVFLFIPLILIAVLYYLIALRIKSRKVPRDYSFNARRQGLRRHRNALRMFIVIVFVFAICWLPFSVIWRLDGVKLSCSFQYFQRIAYFLAISNCAINPCICFISNANYRQALTNLLSCYAASPRAYKAVV